MSMALTGLLHGSTLFSTRNEEQRFIQRSDSLRVLSSFYASHNTNSCTTSSIHRNVAVLTLERSHSQSSRLHHHHLTATTFAVMKAMELLAFEIELDRRKPVSNSVLTYKQEDEASQVPPFLITNRIYSRTPQTRNCLTHLIIHFSLVAFTSLKLGFAFLLFLIYLQIKTSFSQTRLFFFSNSNRPCQPDIDIHVQSREVHKKSPDLTDN
ncbi:hypothetical protein CROQUDRAFT_86660 [Cronartium quercuum f. sp. fusiforme G11]|uniref:Uncharacterized protein n=1 Tax=Cronartium quercuum f. sp. fusiforme G11 TaxID=708437 RepID=A0A9P6NY93_9BASI|nr:hypothetical protein CROQUDRAFT_86660 [Cronartium quercuum f. sp. fusiforme G11]